MIDSRENAFSQYIRILGKGKTGSRSLSFDEAKHAMQLILNEQVADVQLGAFLMLLRVKEESAEEIAGFVSAARENIYQHFHTDKLTHSISLDWSSYAGKRRHPPYYLLAIFALANKDFKVVVHGACGHTEGRIYSEQILDELGFKISKNIFDINDSLEKQSFCFFDLASFCPKLQQIINLRPIFGLRSPVHSLCRLLNPLNADTTLQSVFHPSYMHTHNRAAALLNEQRAIVFKGDSGEGEVRPQADSKALLWSHQTQSEFIIPRRLSSDKAKTIASNELTIEQCASELRHLWNRDVQSVNSYGFEAVISTIQLVLIGSGLREVNESNIESSIAKTREQAKDIWAKRDRSLI